MFTLRWMPLVIIMVGAGVKTTAFLGGATTAATGFLGRSPAWAHEDTPLVA